jgi:uncharacterized membrane protein YdbT with pleckstrin-like domain
MKLFENQQIDITTLPRVRHIDFQKPQKSFLGLTMIRSIIFWFFMFIIFSLCIYLAREEYFEYITYARLAFYPLATFSILMTLISYFKRGHALRDHDIVYKEGVIYRNTTTISFNRIQHCEVSQDIFEQLFDLATIKIFTAGGQSSDLEIPGLSDEDAGKTKEFIINKISTIQLKHGEEE